MAGGFASGQHYNVAARAAAAVGGVLGATAGMPFGESQAFATAGAATGRRIVSNLGQAHQALAQRGQEASGRPELAYGKAAGALLGGAAGGHIGAGAARSISDLVRGRGSGEGTPGPTAGSGGTGGPGRPPPGAAGAAVTAPTGSERLPAAAGGSPPAPGKAGPGVPPATGTIEERGVGLEDIIDFHRLST